MNVLGSFEDCAFVMFRSVFRSNGTFFTIPWTGTVGSSRTGNPSSHFPPIALLCTEIERRKNRFPDPHSENRQIKRRHQDRIICGAPLLRSNQLMHIWLH